MATLPQLMAKIAYSLIKKGVWTINDVTDPEVKKLTQALLEADKP